MRFLFHTSGALPFHAIWPSASYHPFGAACACGQMTDPPYCVCLIGLIAVSRFPPWQALPLQPISERARPQPRPWGQFPTNIFILGRTKEKGRGRKKSDRKKGEAQRGISIRAITLILGALQSFGVRSIGTDSNPILPSPPPLQAILLPPL